MAEKSDSEKEIEEEEEEEEPEEEEEKDFTPPQRKSVASFIIERKTKQIEKLRGKQKDDEEEEEGDKLSPAAQKLLKKEFEGFISPFADAISSTQAEQEVKSFLAQNPEYKKYESKARKYMEVHSRLTAEDAFHLASKGQTIKKEDDEAKEKVKQKALQNRLGGSAARAKETELPSSQKDMKEMYERVKKGETIKLGEEES